MHRIGLIGRLHSAQCILYSVDFAEIEAMQSSGCWTDAAGRLAHAAKCLEAAGADEASGESSWAAPRSNC